MKIVLTGCSASRRALHRAVSRRSTPTTARIFAVLAFVAGAGCSVDERPYPDNLPPATYLAIQGDSLLIADYHIILNWWGTDRDGTVIGYAYRWSDPWRPAAGDSLWWEDAGWTFTTATRDTFDVPIGGERALRTFFVRAIDNDLLADPTPAQQKFPLRNRVPIIAWTDTTRHPTLARPSLPAVSFAWKPQDFDGRATIDYVLLWLDVAAGEDSAAAAIRVAGRDTVGAFFAEHFQGRYGPRTVHAQAFDLAATGSNLISWTWRVTAPMGEYLLIDNAGARGASGQSIARNQDNFWRSAGEGVMERVAPGNYHLYDVWEDGVFRSAQEVLPTLSLFKGVVWYGGVASSATGESDAQMVAGLALAEQALYDYVAGGGNLLITSRDAIGTNGGLRTRFMQETFGLGSIFVRPSGDQYVTDCTLPKGAAVGCGGYFDRDSLKVGTAVSGTDFFRLTARVEPLLSIDHRRLTESLRPEPDSTEIVYAGALATWGAGRCALFSTLLTRFEDPGPDESAEEAIAALVRRLFGL